MLASISGSQGTGKSTLISALPYKTITRKTSRSILTDWNVSLSQVNNDRELTIKFQEEILLRKMADDAEAAQSTELFFTERTFADLFVYALVAVGKDNEYSEWLDGYYERCKAAQSVYDYVFYIQAGHFKPVNDGVRGINGHYSKMVDQTMHHYTSDMSGAGFWHITEPNLQARVDFVNECVQDFEAAVAHIQQQEQHFNKGIA